MLHRRQFVRVVAGASVASLVGRAWGADASAAPAIGIQMYSLRGYDVDTAIEHAYNLGFRSLEFYPGQMAINSTSEQIAALKAKLASRGMTISAHGVNRFTKDHEANRKIFAFVKAAGIKNLSADPDPDSFESLNKLVAEYDVRVAIHNHGPKHRYNKVIDVLNAVEKYDVRIGACADLGHYIRSAESPVEVIRSLGKRLYGVHLKDFAEQADKTKGVILGQGHLDVVGVFQALKQVNFPADGAISLEYEENPKDPLADIRQCAAVAREAAKKVWG